MADKAKIGLIGLGVMGENLALNIERNGFPISIYNRTVEKVDEFVNDRGKGKKVFGYHDDKSFVESLERPRKIILLVKAGAPVDQTVEKLLPYLEKDDIIIDGGNSHFTDTIRREKDLAAKGIRFIGSGVSGGEEGALWGPSLMPGGDLKAYNEIKPVWEAIAAKSSDGPCVTYLGPNGAGHFVKMVHNGIEYGDMQIINEAYHIMKELIEMDAFEQHEVFKKWNKGKLDSYLTEITRDILAYKDEDGTPLVENILDTAGQKGTGKWTAVTALDLGIPLTLIGESVFARCLSAQKDVRVEASKVIAAPKKNFKGDKKQFIDDLENALYASKIVSYAQGYDLMMEAAKENNWDLNYGGIAMLWREGCIIRSVFLKDIKNAFDNNPNLRNLLLDPFFKSQVEAAQEGWRRVCAAAIENGVPVPALSAALAYFDGFRSERLPANLLQAQRDYFGAHMYERVDKPRGEFFHTNWTGHGGDTASTTYQV